MPLVRGSHRFFSLRARLMKICQRACAHRQTILCAVLSSRYPRRSLPRRLRLRSLTEGALARGTATVARGADPLHQRGGTKREVRRSSGEHGAALAISGGAVGTNFPWPTFGETASFSQCQANLRDPVRFRHCFRREPIGDGVFPENSTGLRNSNKEGERVGQRGITLRTFADRQANYGFIIAIEREKVLT